MASVFPCAGSGAGQLIPLSTRAPRALSLSLVYRETTPTFTNGTFIEQTTVDVVDIGVATAVQVEQGVAAQFQNAFNEAIYVTPFGDKPGQIQIEFVANRYCDPNEQIISFDANGNPVNTGVILHGLTVDGVPYNGGSVNNNTVLQHYIDNRLLPSQRTLPATLTVGGVPFHGFLTSVSFAASAGRATLARGRLTFTAWPEGSTS